MLIALRGSYITRHQHSPHQRQEVMLTDVCYSPKSRPLPNTPTRMRTISYTLIGTDVLSTDTQCPTRMHFEAIEIYKNLIHLQKLPAPKPRRSHRLHCLRQPIEDVLRSLKWNVWKRMKEFRRTPIYQPRYSIFNWKPVVKAYMLSLTNIIHIF